MALSTDIISPNLDNGATSPALRRNTTGVGFELRPIDTTPPVKKPGFFAGLLRSLGSFSPLAFALAPITAGATIPLAIAGTAAMGAGMIGNKAAANQMQPTPQGIPTPMAYPGMGAGVAMAPGSFSDPAMDAISSSRDSSISKAVHG